MTSENKIKTTNNLNAEISSGESASEWSNLSKDQLVRGHKLHNIEKRCLELCQSYLRGSWSNAQSTNDITVTRITGGFTNQLYRVQLNQSIKQVPNGIYPKDEPSQVSIKFYQEKHLKNYNPNDGERLNDMIILTLMSQTKLGPKVYGIFNDGFIQGFYEVKFWYFVLKY